jgi:succinate dehydrogenase/fumarate reductase flavoprotein subunit
MNYEQLIKDAPRWPYPVDYGKENEVSCDVLVLGGGIAGCWAAIGAARSGARVVLVDKGAVETSGAGGAGVDHWHAAVTNPASKITPEEFTQVTIDNYEGWRCAISQYITSRESYDCLLDIEKMGMKVRDSDDEFKGAEFRDEKTKLLFAYDYTAKYCVRVWGSNAKPSLYKECRRLGVKIFDHITVTGLLNQGGRQGARIVGAAGVSSRTGEFYIFKGKASVLAMFCPQRQWIFSTEIMGLHSSHRPCTDSGDGHGMAYRAGAEFAQVEQSGRGGGGPFGYVHEGVGYPTTGTWYAVTMVDANGKEIPYVDRDGRILSTVSERYRPVPGQKYFLHQGSGTRYDYKPPQLLPDWPERARKGEFALPLYADLPSMPEHERRVIFSLMVAQEAKTLIGVYRTYTQAGFDPEKDLLQGYDGGWQGIGLPAWRSYSIGTQSGGGLVVDWDLKTSLDGLFAAGSQIFATGDHAYAAATGRYAGRKAAASVKGASEPQVDRLQVEAEKARVYAPVKRKSGVEWKELNAGVCKVMQDYCGEVKNEGLLKLGLKWFEEIEAGEAASAIARNPHELMRLLEVFNIITNGQMILEACRARKASNTTLGFTRSDYPRINPPDWQKWVTLKQDQGHLRTGELALDYHGDVEKNYKAHSGLRS